jgi:glycosyltransferase involved in cell wall biosynthesis
MPVHDGERWLGEALSSVAIQDDAGGIECLVIDSSQGEGTSSLALAYQHRVRLRLIRRPDLKPWQSKTNFGFEQATAAHVSMLHQDDFWQPGRAASVQGWIEAEPDAVMHLHASQIVNEAGWPLGRWTCPLPSGSRIDRELLLDRLLVQNFISIPSPVIRRDAFCAVGGIDEALWYTGDWDLYLKLARTGPVLYHDEVLSAFRIHGGSMTMSGSRNVDDFREQMMRVVDAHIEVVPQSRRKTIARFARASIDVNVGLAAANSGQGGGLLTAASAMLSLGPAALRPFLRDTRLLERVRPRLLARLARSL